MCFARTRDETKKQKSKDDFGCLFPKPGTPAPKSATPIRSRFYGVLFSIDISGFCFFNYSPPLVFTFPFSAGWTSRVSRVCFIPCSDGRKFEFVVDQRRRSTALRVLRERAFSSAPRKATVHTPRVTGFGLAN